MATYRCTLICAIAVWASPLLAAQRPPSEAVREHTEASALDAAEALASRLTTTLGSVGPEANLAIRRWDEAVRLWKKEKGGAAPLLAEGVLFDCLGRMKGVVTRRLSSEQAGPYFSDLAAQRPLRAAKAFDAALKIDSTLTEARMRAARIRATKDPSALVVLERLAGAESSFPISYLSAMIRAEGAQAQADHTAAERWYRQALSLNPGSTAAFIGLRAINARSVASFDSRAPNDLYYSYPCTVLTSAVHSELSMRVQRVVLK